mmetsp:Transcript_24881/g.78734  ORF Transcript_24881/g.78734 Transcript_24881/m.78734 type:complete len:1756 (+) Transcript_24881:378-5645(+)
MAPGALPRAGASAGPMRAAALLLVIIALVARPVTGQRAELDHSDCEGCASFNSACWALVSSNEMCEALPGHSLIRLGVLARTTEQPGSAENQCRSLQLWRERLVHIYGGIPVEGAEETVLYCPVFSVVDIKLGSWMQSGNATSTTLAGVQERVRSLLAGEIGTHGGVDAMLPTDNILITMAAGIVGEELKTPTVASAHTPSSLMQCLSLDKQHIPEYWIEGGAVGELPFPPCPDLAQNDRRFKYLVSVQGAADGVFSDLLSLGNHHVGDDMKVAFFGERSMASVSVASGVAKLTWELGRNFSFQDISATPGSTVSLHEYLFRDLGEASGAAGDYEEDLTRLVRAYRDTLQPTVVVGAVSRAACVKFVEVARREGFAPQILGLVGCGGDVSTDGLPAELGENVRWLSTVDSWSPLFTSSAFEEIYDHRLVNLFFNGSDAIAQKGRDAYETYSVIDPLADLLNAEEEHKDGEWHMEYTTPKGLRSELSPSMFARNYHERWGDAPGGQSAAFMAQAYITGRALVTSGEFRLENNQPSTAEDAGADAEVEELIQAPALRPAPGASFFGNLYLGRLGTNFRPALVTVQYDASGVPGAIAPISAVASSGEVVLIPPWDGSERRYPCPGGTRVVGGESWCATQPEDPSSPGAPPAGCVEAGGVWWAEATCEACGEGEYTPAQGYITCLECDGTVGDAGDTCISDVNDSWFEMWMIYVLVGAIGGLFMLCVFVVCVKNSPAYLRMKERIQKASPPAAGKEITTVVTDIQSSTSLWEWDPAIMDECLQIHHSILRHYLPTFSGFEVTTEGDSFTVVFHEPQDALAWCCQVQAALMDVEWPDELLTLGPDGPIEGEVYEGDETVFRGLRVRMGVHSGMPAVVTKAGHSRVKYKGEVVTVAKNISDTGAGGQIIVSLSSLSHVDRKALPLPTEIYNMGVHRIKDLKGVIQLVQIVPTHLLGRLNHYEHKYGEVTTDRELSPSFFEAPCGKESIDAAIRVWSGGKEAEDLKALGISNRASLRGKSLDILPGGFARLKTFNNKLMSAESVGQTLPEYSSLRTGPLEKNVYSSVTLVFINIANSARLFDWNFHDTSKAIQTLMLVCVGDVLRAHKGYPCEEEDGQLVLAFHTPLDAVLYCCKVQEEALKMEWSEELLTQQEAGEVYSTAADGSQQLLFRGLRMQCGVVCGRPQECRPDARTGRARYTGPVINRTARFCGMASGGQVVVEHATAMAAMEADPALMADIVLTDLGVFKLKGVNDESQGHTVQVSTKGLAARQFPKIRRQQLRIPQPGGGGKLLTRAKTKILGINQNAAQMAENFNIARALAATAEPSDAGESDDGLDLELGMHHVASPDPADGGIIKKMMRRLSFADPAVMKIPPGLGKHGSQHGSQGLLTRIGSSERMERRTSSDFYLRSNSTNERGRSTDFHSPRVSGAKMERIYSNRSSEGRMDGPSNLRWASETQEIPRRRGSDESVRRDSNPSRRGSDDMRRGSDPGGSMNDRGDGKDVGFFARATAKKPPPAGGGSHKVPSKEGSKGFFTGISLAKVVPTSFIPPGHMRGGEEVEPSSPMKSIHGNSSEEANMTLEQILDVRSRNLDQELQGSGVKSRRRASEGDSDAGSVKRGRSGSSRESPGRSPSGASASLSRRGSKDEMRKGSGKGRANRSGSHTGEGSESGKSLMSLEDAFAELDRKEEPAVPIDHLGAPKTGGSKGNGDHYGTNDGSRKSLLAVPVGGEALNSRSTWMSGSPPSPGEVQSTKLETLTMK